MTDFRINVVVDPSGARAGGRVVRRELQQTSTAADRLRATLVRTFAVLGGTAALTGAVRQLASFEQELSTVRAITGATQQQFAALREEAIQLGTTTRFSATQAAEGLTFLARAGFTAEEAIGAIGGTLQLAQAGALDLGSAADIASNALTGFRLEVDQTGRVVDVLALAANSSNTTVGQLGEALKFVAPVAAGVGVSIEEATAAIGSLSDAGLQASLAGTGLRRILSELESPSAKTRDILRSLGVTADEVRISQVGLTSALDTLAQAGVDTGTALEIFGDRGGPAFEVLRTAAGDVEAFAERLENAEGTAARIADTMDDNLNGAILSVRSAFEGLILRLGESGATGALRTFFTTLASVLRLAADNIGAFVNVLEGLAFVLGVSLARRAIPATITAIRSLGVAIATNPIGALATVLTLTVGALVAFRNELTLTADSTVTLGMVASEVFNSLRDTFNSFVPAIQEVARAIDEQFGTAFAGFELNIQNVLLTIGAVTDASIAILLAFGNTVVALFTGIGPAIGEAFVNILNGVIRFVETGTDRVRAFLNAVAGTASGVGTQVVIFFRELDIAATQLAQGLPGAAAETASQAADQLTRQLTGIGDTFATRFRGELRQLEAEDLLSELGNPFEGAGEDLGNAVTDGFNEGLSFSGATDLLLEAIDNANQAALAGGAQIGANLGAGVESGAGGGGVPNLNTGAGADGGITVGTNTPPVDPEFTSIIDEIGGAQTRLNTQVAAYQQLLDDGTISQNDFNFAVANASVEARKFDTSLSGGLDRGLNRIKAQITDVGSAVENTLVNAFGAAEDALVEFVTTGEFNFSKLVDSILEDLTRLLIRQALLSLIGGGAGAAAGGAISGFAAGTSSTPANEPILVGEEGPEIFNPSTSGAVIPNDQTMAAIGAGQQSSPEVNVTTPPAQVQVAVVKDPDEVRNFLRSDEGQQEIIDINRKNSNVLGQL